MHQHDGLLAVFDENRAKLVRYFLAHGAGDAAEDCIQELWLRISATKPGPIASPLSYLFRAATNLMTDRHRAERQARQRDYEWSELAGLLSESVSEMPSADRELVSREQLARVAQALASLPTRAAKILKLHRIEGLSQREVAAKMGLSASTIESELRQAYRVLIEVRERLDEE